MTSNELLVIKCSPKRRFKLVHPFPLCYIFTIKSIDNLIRINFHSQKRSRKREKEKHSENGPAEENEEVDDEVKKLAQHFEEKYVSNALKRCEIYLNHVLRICR